MSRAPIRVLDAPFHLGLRPPAPGVEPGAHRLAGALKQQGLVSRLQATAVGHVAPPPYADATDHHTGFLNGPALAPYSEALADAVGTHLDTGEFLLVLGGDCSILLGATLALRERGRYGLAYFDAHDDYSYILDPARRGRYTAAGLALALATDHGPAELSNLRNLGPYVRESDVVHLGLSRTEEECANYNTAPFDSSAVTVYGQAAIRSHGPEIIGPAAVQRLSDPGRDGFWIHLDADVLDQSVMPAVDSPNPAGLNFEELVRLLAPLLASPKAVGMQITIYDPDLDPDGIYAARFCDALVQAFEAAGRIPASAAA